MRTRVDVLLYLGYSPQQIIRAAVERVRNEREKYIRSIHQRRYDLIAERVEGMEQMFN